MSEPVLKSIMQLMAISAITDGTITEAENRLISDFIAEQVSREQVEDFLSLFKQYVEIALSGSIDTSKISQKINRELNQKQKILVIFYLFELIIADKSVSNLEAELAFTDSIAQAFNLNPQEYESIKAFMLDDDMPQHSLKNLLLVSNNPAFEESKIKHIYQENFDAMLSIIRIPSVDMYMLKYYAGGENTFLNGLLLRSRHVYTFSHGATIRTEKSNPIFYADIVSKFSEDNQQKPISFEAKHLYYAFPNGYLGLRDINIAESGGKLIGIMGASGSGKSTLLNVLNGSAVPVKGEVLINGLNIYAEKNAEQIKGVIGYVPQDDLLIEELTVFENLYYAAKLCFAHYTEQQIRKLVYETLSNLGLQERSHLKVGNPLQKTISGGQRKRLNIGLELLRQPAIMFVDEPTSGLSSRDSENIMDLLKELTRKGKIIFVVIHQPSSDIYKMFDKMIILDVGGYQIYYGDPIEAVIYFRKQAALLKSEQGVCPTCGNVNPEQIFNIVESKVIDDFGNYTKERKISPAQWRKLYEQHLQIPSIVPSTEPPPKSLFLPSLWKQMLIFMQRDVKAKLNNIQYLFISLLEAPFLAFILAYIVRYYYIDVSQGRESYIFFENMNIPAYLFMSVIVSLFIGLTVSAEEIIKDAKILQREKFLHLSRTSYLFSKLGILFTLSAIQSFSFVWIGNSILEIKAMFFPFWLILFSTSCFANVLGLNISATFNSVVTIYILIPVLLIPQLVLGGIVVKFDDINPHLASDNKVPLVSELMASRWAYEAMMVYQFMNNPYQKQFYDFDRKIAIAEYKRLYYIPKLETKISNLVNNLTSKEKVGTPLLAQDLQVLRTEVRKEMEISPNVKPKFTLHDLENEKFNLHTAQLLKDYTDRLKKYYNKIYLKYIDAKDHYTKQVQKTKSNPDYFTNQLLTYQNEAIANLVKNSTEVNRIAEVDGQFIQKIYPIFLEPDDIDFWLDFRTHFFAPTKHFAGKFYPTPYFNVCIIWLMSFILYVTLYFDIFKESLKTISSLNRIIKTKLQRS
ncbi:MAG: ATP-binding cassette domain-containing protein [Microscillaceae bacterium]|nr:ATP-binding cassette domain-containing protein [Microscillaceae bacterium]MDW8459701.1 ATP-binding cassette domain-containing protein [Cytophagales bacterium]